MSRHTVSNLHSFELFIASLFGGDRIGHRHLISLYGSPDDGIGSDLGSQPPRADHCFVNARTSINRADRITGLLGKEHSIIVHELSDPMDAGLLAALTGTLMAGGVLMLVMPKYPKAYGPSTSTTRASRFSQRFGALLDRGEENSPRYLHRVSVIGTGISLNDMAQILTEAADRTMASAQGLTSWRPGSAREQQDQLLQDACRFLQAHSRGCITITGRRGRGKSALLARIADSLYSQGIDFAVTAASTTALGSFRQHFNAQPHQINLNPHAISTALAPVLLVDEASNLPVNVLINLLDVHDQVVFCTTVDGYESAGRAFDIRLVQYISASNVPWLDLTPTRSWRWGTDDALEQLVNKLVIDDTKEVPMHNPSASTTRLPNLGNDVTNIEEISQQQLSASEPLLRQIFHLLRQTHYQTSVQDLQHLLDGDDVRLWVLQHVGDVIGVVVLALEGDIETVLHQPIVDKQRRLPHQLLPQLLAQMANSANALNKRYARVIRISIASESRQRGLGSLLLNTVEAQLVDSSPGAIHALGASFAADRISLAFWKKNGYSEFHRGFRLNPRTGRHAVAVIKPCCETVNEVTRKAVSIHQDNQSWRDTSKSVELTAPMNHGNLMTSSNSSATTDIALLTQFSLGQRSAHDSHAALARLQAHRLIDGPGGEKTSQRARDADLRQQVRRFLATQP